MTTTANGRRAVAWAIIYMWCIGLKDTVADFCDTHYCGPFEPDKLLEQVAKSVMTQDSASVEKGRHTAEQNENIISLLKQLHSHRPCVFGDEPLCVYECRCTNGCDRQTGACLRGGRCSQGRPSRFPWHGPACQIGNVASGRNAVQKTGATARRVVDGDTDPTTRGRSCASQSTAGGVAKWFVNLNQKHVVLEVTVFSSDKASEQLKVFLVGVSSVSHRGVFVKSTYALCGRNLRPVSVQGSATIRCVQPLVGRTVAVINSKSKMTVCEIVVIGYLYSGNQLNKCRNGSKCPLPCRCTKGCDPRTGDCLRDGKCDEGKILPWRDGPSGRCQDGNIAYGRRAAMPSATDTSKLTGPEKGVDGELHMDSCVEAATGRRTEPAWYRVDLGALHVVVSVTAFNGLDKSSSRMNTFVVRAGMSTVLDENEICLQFHQPSRPVPAGGAAADKCNFPLVARHVSLQQQDPANIQVFHMCEFAVRGYQLPALPLRVPLLAPRVLRLPRDCADLADDGFWQSGVYSIYVRSDYRWVDVWCDLDQDSLGETASGGWTVIMHRKDGTEDFDRTWKEYEAGFGNVNGEFWFGNEIVYKMTAARSYQLKVTLVLPTNLKRFIIYDKFRLGSNISDYTLEIGLARKHQRVANVDCYTGWGYDYKGTFNTTRTGRVCADWAAAKAQNCSKHLKPSAPDNNYCRNTKGHECDYGEPFCYTTDPNVALETCGIPKCDNKYAGDSLLALNTYKFSTKDQKTTDSRVKIRCPGDRGGWWHGSSCSGANLNGKYLTSGRATFSHMQWRTATSGPIVSASMMIRPID